MYRRRTRKVELDGWIALRYPEKGKGNRGWWVRSLERFGFSFKLREIKMSRWIESRSREKERDYEDTWC